MRRKATKKPSREVVTLVRSNRKRLAAESTEFAEALTMAVHTPQEALVISPSMRVHLEIIRGMVRNMGKLSTALIISAPEAPDHETFKHRDMDLATIDIALDEKNPKEFFMPLFGGEAFLAHIPRCLYCVASFAATPDDAMKDPDLAFLMKVLFESYISEAERWGLHPSGDAPHQNTIGDFFKKPTAQ